MSYTNKTNKQHCKTIVSKQQKSNSVSQVKAPDYLITSIESTSIISIDSKNYLSLRCDLNKENLFQVDDLTIDNTIFWIDCLR